MAARRGLSFAGCLVTAALGLGACTVPPPNDASTPHSEPIDSAARSEALAATDPAPAEPELPVPPPFRTIPLAQVTQATLLGEPVLSRTDREAKLLRFRGETCRLFAFLYPGPTADSPFEVNHVEAETLDGAEVPAADCLAKFRREAPPKTS